MASCTREIRYARHFPGTAAHQTSFTANANQSNECTVTARVARKEVCGCHRGKNDFTTVVIDFYHRGIDFYHSGI